MRTIAVDAMGGDSSPRVEVEGAVAAARSGEVRVVLVGRREVIGRELRRLSIDEAGRPLRFRSGPVLPLSVHHAEQVITMNDHPAQAVRRKRRASMCVAAQMVAAGEVDAVVSAGNSGAMVACGLLVIGRLRGVDRPGILTTLPSLRGDVVLLDTGANVDCRPANLVQYAVMGSCYAREVLGRMRPSVGLLANGTESHKGTELTRETDGALRARSPEGADPAFDYVGYVEGADLFAGNVDVVVSDGFSGNLVLKVSEGVAEAVARFTRRELTRSVLGRVLALPLLPVYRRLRRRVDYAEQGGAPLLGVRGNAIICHGRSNAKAIRNAVLRGARYAGQDLARMVEREIEAHRWLIPPARPGASAGSGNGRVLGHPAAITIPGPSSAEGNNPEPGTGTGWGGS